MSCTQNRTGRSTLALAISGLPTATLIMTAFMAAVPATRAQNAVPAPAQSANQGASSQANSAASPRQAPANSANGTGAASSTTSVAGGQAADKSGKKAAVCFKLTGRCIQASKTSGAKGGPAAGGAGTSKDSTSQRALNLNAPDVRSVVPAEQLKEPLPTNDQIVETQESDTVDVRTDKGVPPDVPGGFGALWWALNHPSQAWRILAPAE